MDKKWTSHLNKNLVEKQELENLIKGSSRVLNRLVELLDKELTQSRREQKNIDHYETPNWELRQVDCNATQRTLEKVIDLCKI